MIKFWNKDKIETKYQNQDETRDKIKIRYYK